MRERTAARRALRSITQRLAAAACDLCSGGVAEHAMAQRPACTPSPTLCPPQTLTSTSPWPPPAPRRSWETPRWRCTQRTTGALCLLRPLRPLPCRHRTMETWPPRGALRRPLRCAPLSPALLALHSPASPAPVTVARCTRVPTPPERPRAALQVQAPGGARGGGAHVWRPPHQDHCRRVRGPRVWHGRAQDHAGCGAACGGQAWARLWQGGCPL